MTITVYTKPACVQCNATYKAPVVIAGDKHWSGFRPDHIKALAKEASLSSVAS